MAYDYRDEMENDIHEWIKDNLEYYINMDEVNNPEDIATEFDADAIYNLVYDDMFVSDLVTGVARRC